MSDSNDPGLTGREDAAPAPSLPAPPLQAEPAPPALAPHWQSPGDVTADDLIAQFGTDWGKSYGHRLLQGFAFTRRSLGRDLLLGHRTATLEESVEQIKQERAITRSQNLQDARNRVESIDTRFDRLRILVQKRFNPRRAAENLDWLARKKDWLAQASLDVENALTDPVTTIFLPKLFHHQGRLALGSVVHVLADGDLLSAGLPVFEARVVTEHLCLEREGFTLKIDPKIHFEYKVECEINSGSPRPFDLNIVAIKGRLTLKEKFGYQLFLTRDAALARRMEMVQQITNRLAATAPA